MSQSESNSYQNLEPYIPASLSELRDQITVMIFEAPTFVDDTGGFLRSVDSEFDILTRGYGVVRKKLGEERHATLLDLAARAKALFAADQDDTNGKTDEGRALLLEMEDILKDVSRRRVKAKSPDDEGEITGD